MQQIQQITGTGLPLLLDDIDTDRIIPARYLRCVTFEGLDEHAFEDDRRQDPQHPFDDPRFQNASVLLVGRNFGCGSSREHAPQALIRWGIRAIIGESFAEIFAGNCTGLGVPAVRAARENLETLTSIVQRDPATTIVVDLAENTVRFGEESFSCEMPASSREALLTGRWDFLGQLLEAEAEIHKTAQGLPYVTGFASTSFNHGESP